MLGMQVSRVNYGNTYKVSHENKWTYLSEHESSYLHIVCLGSKSTQDSTKAMMIQLIDQGVNPYLLDKHGRNVAIIWQHTAVIFFWKSYVQ